jgi:hypothetical protein
MFSFPRTIFSVIIIEYMFFSGWYRLNESKLFGASLPSHPNLQPILEDIRANFNIPEIGLEDEDYGEFLLSDVCIPWDIVSAESKEEFFALDELTPDTNERQNTLLLASQSVISSMSLT